MLVGQKLNHRENIHGQPLSWSETTRTWFNGHGSNLFDPQKWIAQSMPKKNQTIIFWPSGKNPNFGPCSIPKMYMSENAELPPSYGHKIHGERYFQRKFQDAKMEVLYHMNPYKAIFGGDIPWHIPYRGLIIYIYCRYCTSNLGSCSGHWLFSQSSDFGVYIPCSCIFKRTDLFGKRDIDYINMCLYACVYIDDSHPKIRYVYMQVTTILVGFYPSILLGLLMLVKQ